MQVPTLHLLPVPVPTLQLGPVPTLQLGPGLMLGLGLIVRGHFRVPTSPTEYLRPNTANTFRLSNTLYIPPHQRRLYNLYPNSSPSQSPSASQKSRTPRHSEVLGVYHCCIVDSLVCPPLWLYLLICSTCDLVYNSGLTLAEALSYSFRTSCQVSYPL